MSPINYLMSRIRDFAADCRGISVVEFAFTAPVLLLLSMGTYDIGSLVLANLKVYNAASSMADLVSRDKTISSTTLTDLFQAAAQVATPFDLTNSGKVIITSVSADSDNDPRIFWQIAGAGTLSAESSVGSTVGGPASLPSELQVEEQETIIVSEVFYHFVPLFGLLTSETTIHHSAYFRPRLGTLREVN